MAVLEIFHFPNPILRKRAHSVEAITPEIKRMVTDMLETMYASRGIGLAAIQVGLNFRIVVIDISEEQNKPQVFINPVISQMSGEQKQQEGCLSVPGVYDYVTRATKISLQFLTLENTLLTLEAEGMQAVCIQHEIDHLDGKLFVDYLSQLKRFRIRKKMLKLAKENITTEADTRR